MAKKYLAGLLTGVAVVYVGDKVFKKDAVVESAVAAPSLATRAKVFSDVPVLLGAKESNGRWMVVGKNGITEARLREICGLFKACGKVGHPGRGVPFFEVHASEAELEKVLALAPGEFDFVEEDQVVTLEPEEEDEVTASASRSWGLDRVDAPNRFATGAGAHIYVVDTGIRVSHSDFGNRAIPAIDVFLGGGGVTECNGDTSCAADRQGHGTHCAGTAAGTEFGVATGALVYAVKGLSDQGSGSSSGLVACMDWVANSGNRPAVASLSLGSAGVSSMWRVTIDRVTAAGVTVVVTAGNANSDACTRSPAHVRSAITTGSTTSTDERSGFSGWGECVDIFAPGSRINSAIHTSDTGSSIKSGTSMACPHVSGAAALVLSQNLDMQPADVYAEIVSRVERGALGNWVAGDKNYLLWVGNGPAPVPAPTPAPPPTPVRVCPSFAAIPRPDGDGDCRCAIGACSRDGQTRNCPTSGSIGGYGGRYFYYTCEDCRCFETLPSSSMVMA